MILGRKFLSGAIGIALLLASISIAHAQTATFSYNDGVGTPNAGDYAPGSSFTFTINLAFAPGGTVSNLIGFSYWFEDRGPSASAPYNFAITNRDFTGSQFTDPQTFPTITYPQNMTPQNPSDLGALTTSGSPVGAGNYLVAQLTISISASAAPGQYVIESTTSPANRVSVISDSSGHTFAIPQAQYTINVVPEPGSVALIATGLSLFGAIAIRRRS